MTMKSTAPSAVAWRLLFLAPVLIGLSSCISELQPQPPAVPQGAVWIDTVTRGAITVETGGLGRLRPAGRGRFKAVLLFPQIAEEDLELGQSVAVQIKDTSAAGKVTKIQDPSNGVIPVEVALSGPLPRQARDGFPVSGTIELGHLDNVLRVGRPVFGQSGTTVRIFKLDAKGEMATQVNVKLGKASMKEIQILDGLKEGDRVILSDMSRWDNIDRITIDR